MTVVVTDWLQSHAQNDRRSGKMRERRGAQPHRGARAYLNWDNGIFTVALGRVTLIRQNGTLPRSCGNTLRVFIERVLWPIRILSSSVLPACFFNPVPSL
jgi:hypothetical protein